MSEFQYLDGGNSEAQDRLASSFLFAQDSTGLVTDGVLTGLVVSQTGTASASVLIAAGAGVVQDTVLNGVAFMVNDTQKTLDVLTAWPMGGTPRNDLVVFDSATKTIRPIQGTPNAIPDDPAVPSTAIPLARLRHDASATTVPTSAIDDLRVFVGLAGGLVTVASQAARDRITAVDGLRVFRTDTKVVETYFGGQWRAAPFAEAAGYYDMVNQAAGNLSQPAISFPAGLFTSAPVVEVTAGHYRQTVAVAPSSVTTSGFTMQIYNNTAAATGVVSRCYWTARQMTG